MDGAARARRFDESLALTYTDGIVILHRGRIVYERYFGALDEETLHLAMSVTSRCQDPGGPAHPRGRARRAAARHGP